MDTDKWTLVAEFDDLTTQEKTDPTLAIPDNDECSQLIRHLTTQWTLRPKEFRDLGLAEWTPTKITFQLESLDLVEDVLSWLTSHTAPQSVTLTRNEDRI